MCCFDAALGSFATRQIALGFVLVLGLGVLAACQQPSRSLGRARGPDAAPLDSFDAAMGTDPLDGGTTPASLIDVYFHPSAPADADDAFAGPPSADPVGAPQVVYPLPEAMLAGNMAVTVQWARAAQVEIFRVRLRGNGGESRAFAGAAACAADQCVIELPEPLWLRLAAAHAGGSVVLMIDAVAATGSPVHTSAPRTLFFSPEPLTGGLTYWSSQLNGLMRQPLGGAPTPYLPAGTATTERRCVGCHAVSRDGCLTSAATEISFANRQLLIVDPQTQDRSLVPGNETVFQAWSPDRQYLLTVLHGKVSLRNAQGVWLDELPGPLFGEGVQALVSHAAWSPDGKFLVFTRLPAGSQTVDPTLYSGDIVRLPFRGVKDYGPAQTLVAHSDNEFHFYPSVSPDGQWVVFATGSRPGRSFFAFTDPSANFSAYAQQTARLRLVPAGGGAVVELQRATFAPNSTATWPQFAPFSQNNGSLFFVVFSSKLDYGFELQQAQVPMRDRSLPGRLQIWIAGVDVSRAGDPSYAPFWLPQQQKQAVNHHGQWSTRLPTTAQDCGF